MCRLQQLLIGPDTTLCVPAFAVFLAECCPALQRLQLVLMCADPGEWKVVWDAIAHHPKRMWIELETFLCNAPDFSGEIDFIHFTGMESSQERLEGEDEWMDVKHSLVMYLSRLRE
jgi:hypothetical protein